MKKSSKKGDLLAPSAKAVYGNPKTVEELVNKFGTYNIQPTAESDNEYPKIAAGLPKGQKG